MWFDAVLDHFINLHVVIACMQHAAWSLEFWHRSIYLKSSDTKASKSTSRPLREMQVFVVKLGGFMNLALRFLSRSGLRGFCI